MSDSSWYQHSPLRMCLVYKKLVKFAALSDVDIASRRRRGSDHGHAAGGRRMSEECGAASGRTDKLIRAPINRRNQCLLSLRSFRGLHSPSSFCRPHHPHHPLHPLKKMPSRVCKAEIADMVATRAIRLKRQQWHHSLRSALASSRIRDYVLECTPPPLWPRGLSR